MKTYADWQLEHYPKRKLLIPPPDYMRINYLEYVVQELEARLAALEAPQPPIIATFNDEKIPIWPPSAQRCTCEKFNGDDGQWLCWTCGKGRF